MKNLLFLTSLTSLGLLVNPASAAVSLVNGGFETGTFSGWSGNLLGLVGAPGVGAQEGSFAARLSVPGGGGVPEANQVFAAAPGEEFNFSGWMLTEATIPTGPSFGLFKIVFKNSGGGDIPVDTVAIGGINNAFPGAESTPFLNNASPINTWTFSQVQATAPVGTVSVQFLALNVDFAGGENPIWFDGIQASQVPEPASGSLAGLGALALLIRRRKKEIAD